eukprot:NODE_801_length_4112_cov_0.079990.p4 type:complete len:238 gc:universal NODE_801_length_4112_cov_0.079990:412-1125(+)
MMWHCSLICGCFSSLISMIRDVTVISASRSISVSRISAVIIPAWLMSIIVSMCIPIVSSWRCISRMPKISAGLISVIAPIISVPWQGPHIFISSVIALVVIILMVLKILVLIWYVFGVVHFAFGTHWTKPAQIHGTNKSTQMQIPTERTAVTKSTIVEMAFTLNCIGIYMSIEALLIAAFLIFAEKKTFRHLLHIEFVQILTIITFLAEISKPVLAYNRLICIVESSSNMFIRAGLS